MYVCHVTNRCALWLIPRTLLMIPIQNPFPALSPSLRASCREPAKNFALSHPDSDKLRAKVKARPSIQTRSFFHPLLLPNAFCWGSEADVPVSPSLFPWNISSFPLSFALVDSESDSECWSSSCRFSHPYSCPHDDPPEDPIGRGTELN